MMPTDAVRVITFGQFRLDPTDRKLYFDNEPVSLGGRAMDILMILADNMGDIVKKDDLIAAGWPDIFVHESNLKVTVAGLRRALRQHAPAHEYINTVVGRGYWLGTAKSAPGTDDRPAAASVLPVAGEVIGRDEVIVQVCQTIAGNRLTTIVGAGGLGKTTVALAAAARLAEPSGPTVTYVDLSRVQGEEFVASTIAAELGVSSNGGENLQAIVSVLGRRKALLLLDTCEHVPNAVAHFCNVVLAGTANVRILATSRRVLRANDEKVVWLPPLEVPSLDHAERADDVLRYAAPQLLALRAAERTGYMVDDKDARAVAEICRRLDGAPLAIELVSSRFAGRDANEVLDELKDRFRLLRQDRPGGPLRHQTLLLTLEWSYALLSRDEGTVLRAISVFAGPFDMDAAVALMAMQGFTPADTFDALAGLVAKSMLSPDQISGELRHRLLDTTRAFANDLLNAHGEVDTVSKAHAEIQLQALRKADSDQREMPGRDWKTLHGRLADDLRKALTWALDQGGNAKLAVELVAAGLPLWQKLSLGSEGRRNCSRALAVLDRLGSSDATLELALLTGLARFNVYLSDDPKETTATFERAVELARACSDAAAEFRILAAFARFSMLGRKGEKVEPIMDAMRVAVGRVPDRSVLWELGQLRAELDAVRGNFPGSRDTLEALLSDINDHPHAVTPAARTTVTIIKKNLGGMYCFTGRPALGWAHLDDVADSVVSLDQEDVLIECLANGLVSNAIEWGDLRSAGKFCDLLGDTIWRHGMAGWAPLLAAYQAAIAALAGEERNAGRLRAASENLRTGAPQLRSHGYLAILSRSMLAIGQPTDAAVLIDGAMAAGPQRWVHSELLRIRASIARAFGQTEEAKTILLQSFDIADQTGMLGYKLRAANDLADLLVEEGQPEAARAVLRPIRDQFTDGYETSDLKRSGAILRVLERG